MCAYELCHADFSMNKIEASEGVVEFWGRALPQIKVDTMLAIPPRLSVSKKSKRVSGKSSRGPSTPPKESQQRQVIFDSQSFQETRS